MEQEPVKAERDTRIRLKTPDLAQVLWEREMAKQAKEQAEGSVKPPPRPELFQPEVPEPYPAYIAFAQMLKTAPSDSDTKFMNLMSRKWWENWHKKQAAKR